MEQSHFGRYDGVVSFQTLSWLPEYKMPIEKMIELRPKWIAMTSLFFDGDVNCTIIVHDYTTPLGGKPYRESYYNTYSIRLVRELFAKLGYSDFKFMPFEIDIDLPKSETRGMGTYTEILQNGRRIQISGPLLMNWYFILARQPQQSTGKF
jgi:hypothetical protein